MTKNIFPYPFMSVLKDYRRSPSVFSLKRLGWVSLYYFTRIIFGKDFTKTLNINYIKSELEGVIITQPIDSLFENYVIYCKNIFDLFYDAKADDVVIDVGAHVGIFTLKMAKKVRNGLVIAVEPYRPNYDLLVRNTKRNCFNNVLPINIALSNSCGEAKLYIDSSSIGHSIVKRGGQCVDVKVVTLDALAEELKLSKVDFIKINAEEAELNILKGAQETLEKNDLKLAIAGNHYPAQEQCISKFLSTIGFRLLIYGNHFVYASKSRVGTGSE